MGWTHNIEEVLIKPVWKGEFGYLPSLFHFNQSFWLDIVQLLTCPIFRGLQK